MRFFTSHPVLIIFILAVMALAGYTGNAYIQKQEQRGGSRWGSGPVQVVVAPVVRQQLVDQVESIGTARANESVALTAKVTETVTAVNFEDGMYVNKGQVLVELTNSEGTAQLAEAKAAVGESSRQFQRVRNLIAQNLASETQLDIERARMQTAQARLEAIEARLDDRLIRAPFSGVLGFRNISDGTLLSPNTVITTLDDISRIKLDFSVPEVYLAALAQGQQIMATSSAYPDVSFDGVVATINSRVDPVTRSVSVRAVLDNKDGMLRPGMLLTVALVRNRTDALVIPEEAVIPMEDRHFVYVIDNNKAQRVAIKIGRQRPGLVEVTDGLTEGISVVTQGIIKLRPGAEVVIKPDASPFST